MFGKSKEIKRLKQRETDLMTKHNDFVIEISKLKDKLKEIKESALKAGQIIEKERNELKKMVREQTQADLLINALKAVGIIHVHKPDQIDYWKRNESLLAMQQQAASMSTSLMDYQGGLWGR